ncbi:MAG: dehydrogenase E1 component subunit alpha/beta [Candidatus Marinimicrobia bacterium]|nr:dehydrogenase E1 component subunit alpha/beta [Candidatus Neomarinimicrobiota bacterium]MCF7828405.1 dehydrogenase E1 component subunit alpha/beta [Candidatus Neomarinimicrobiota bacterium]MCF7881001.1 dehydrogenase E1 component subunit alpha/beta [Candidatus Neomarinimicrobiota bacterium]
MRLARGMDNKMLTLLKQGKSYFHIGTSGHEAAQIALGFAMQPGHDWFYPYYRDLTFCLTLGVTPKDTLLQFLSRDADPASGARQMPQHFGDSELHIVSQSSPTGTQYLQAAGCAMGNLKKSTDEIVMVSSGEGTTSQGDFHEALNIAGREKLPLIFFVEDNHFAISVHKKQQTAGSIYDLVQGYENLARFEMDGTDFFESYEVVQQAVKRARDGEGPSVVVADVIRLLPHSSSDDHKKYKTKEQLEEEQNRDPIPKFESLLLEEGFATGEDLEEIQSEVKQEINDAANWALDQPFPDKSTATDNLYAMDYEPPALKEPSEAGKKIMMVDAINHALHEEMRRDERVLVFGQDVEDGKGGVFTATKGLSTEFGNERCFNSPLAESTIVGTAIGLATRGFLPVAEIQFGDYIWTGMMQLRNELSTLRYRSDNDWSAPVVVRVPVGGYIHGGLYHSQSIDGYFSHMPGLRVVFPSNAADAKGLLKTAIRCPDPVLFLEQKGMYRQQFSASPGPGEDYLLPFGHANVVREGEDVTVIAWGSLVQRSVEAAKELAKDNISVEIIDIRTLNPLDEETIFESVQKTNKVLVAHEDNLTGGFGGEIASRIADECFMYLDGPVKRLAAEDCHIPFNWDLESVILPQKDDIVNALRELIAF